MDQDKRFAASLQQLIYKLLRDYEFCDRICLTQHGVTASQAYTLLALPRKANLTMNALSEAMGLANSTMTRMIDNLVERGLVYRRPDDEDRRAVRVGLTDQGARLRHTLQAAQEEVFEAALEEIPKEERPVILRALEQVTNCLEKALAVCCRK